MCCFAAIEDCSLELLSQVKSFVFRQQNSADIIEVGKDSQAGHHNSYCKDFSKTVCREAAPGNVKRSSDDL